MKAIISGGGTGGHIFPALAIAQSIKKHYPDAEILFVGANGRMEMDRVPKAGFEIIGLDIEGLDRKRIWRNFAIIWKYLKAVVEARRIIQSFKADICIGVGGYVSAPTLKAAQSLGIPTLIQEQNSYAGKSNKHVSRRANRIAVAYPDMDKFFPKDKIVFTGNPIRQDIENISVTKEDSLTFWGFPSDAKKVLLVIGGSLGARTINESIGESLDKLVENGIYIIWQTGKAFEEKASLLAENYKGRVYTSAFINRMDYAYMASDIVISRAGASSISELQVLSKVAILVPSPNVAEDHQTKNALALSMRNAAIMVPDKEAKCSLANTAIALMNNEEEKRILSQEISKMAMHNSADLIVEEIKKILDNKNK